MCSMSVPEFPNTVHRVSVREDMVTVDVITLGIDKVDGFMDGVYTVDQLPDWVQERLAVLSICTLDSMVEGIGKRVTDSVFWIYED